MLSTRGTLLRTQADHAGSPRALVQESVIQAVAAVADCAQELFVDYYDAFMPPVLAILQAEGGGDKAEENLRNRSFECASILCEAVPERSVGAVSRAPQTAVQL